MDGIADQPWSIAALQVFIDSAKAEQADPFSDHPAQKQATGKRVEVTTSVNWGEAPAKVGGNLLYWKYDAAKNILSIHTLPRAFDVSNPVGAPRGQLLGYGFSTSKSVFGKSGQTTGGAAVSYLSTSENTVGLATFRPSEAQSELPGVVDAIEGLSLKADPEEARRLTQTLEVRLTAEISPLRDGKNVRCGKDYSGPTFSHQHERLESYCIVDVRFLSAELLSDGRPLAIRAVRDTKE